MSPGPKYIAGVLGLAFFGTLAVGCAGMRPVPPPIGKAQLKLTWLRADGTANGCGDSILVCRINDVQHPAPINTFMPTKEQDQSGRWALYHNKFLLDPGPQRLLIEWGMNICEQDSTGRKAIHGAGQLLAGGIIFGLLPEIDKVGPVAVDFDAVAGRNYVIDCDKDKTPWVWVTPEDQR